MPWIPALLLLLFVPAAGWSQVAAAARTVTVSAAGTVEREPEQAVLMLAVESFAPSAEEAARQNAERMERLIAALRGLGIPEDRIRTVSYYLNPEYDRDLQREGGEPRVVGYRAVNRVQVTIDPVEETGAVIDTAIEAGANRVEGLTFQLRDPDAVRRDALREAVRQARAEAEALAGAAGLRLGPLLQLATGDAPPRPFPISFDARAMVAQSAETPVEPGTIEVTATVTAVYRLEPQ